MRVCILLCARVCACGLLLSVWECTNEWEEGEGEQKPHLADKLSVDGGESTRLGRNDPTCTTARRDASKTERAVAVWISNGITAMQKVACVSSSTNVKIQQSSQVLFANSQRIRRHKRQRIRRSRTSHKRPNPCLPVGTVHVLRRRWWGWGTQHLHDHLPSCPVTPLMKVSGRSMTHTEHWGYELNERA